MAPRAAQAADLVAADARPGETAPSRPSVIVSANPLPLTYGTFSAQLEILASPSVGVVLNPHFASFSEHHDGLPEKGNEGSDTTVRGFGGELGLRYYPNTMTIGQPCVFMGPSILMGHYSGTTTGDKTTPEFTRFGMAFDVGMTMALKSGFSFTVGGGLQYMWKDGSANLGSNGGGVLSSVTTASIMFGDGLRPRVLASVGWVF
jgi:hypothetical protein